MAHAGLADELAALAKLPLAQLRQQWPSVSDKPVPRASAALLRLALAWEIQAKAHGGLSRQLQQKLGQIEAARTQTRNVRPGMRLVREWNGTLHIVTIGHDGTIMWNGKHWKSLSVVAREITGTRWSGPAFFGLKQKKAA